MKKNKKIIIAGLSVLAVASVTSIGLASWLVGVTRDNVNTNLDVVVDTASNTTLFLTAELTSTQLEIAELKPYEPGQDETVIVTRDDVGENPQGLKFNFTQLKLNVGESLINIIEAGDAIVEATQEVPFTLQKQADSSLALVDSYYKLTLSLPESANGVSVNQNNKLNGASEDLFGRDENTEYQYLTLNKDLELIETNVSVTEITSDGSYDLVYQVPSEGYSFEWGSFFGGVTPSKFYNSKANPVGSSLGIDELKAMSSAAKQELDAMHAALNGDDKLTIKVAVEAAL